MGFLVDAILNSVRQACRWLYCISVLVFNNTSAIQSVFRMLYPCHPFLCKLPWVWLRYSWTLIKEKAEIWFYRKSFLRFRKNCLSQCWGDKVQISFLLARLRSHPAGQQIAFRTRLLKYQKSRPSMKLGLETDDTELIRNRCFQLPGSSRSLLFVFF